MSSSPPTPVSGKTPTATEASTPAKSTKPTAPPRAVPTYLRPLEFVGIPKAVLTWQPRLPSRNWSIFLVTVGTLSYLYYDDRKQCRLIKQDYIDKVRHLADQPMKPSEWPRKITVYATRSPGDDDYDKAMRYFKKYVKPVLVAAGIDWEVTNGTRHGGLARMLQGQIHERRRKLLGLEPWMDEKTAMLQTAFSLNAQQELQRELDGGVVLVGRPALKEWAWALEQGWCTPLEAMRRDRDDELAQELAEDHTFDEVVDASTNSLSDFPDDEDKAIVALEGEADGAGAPIQTKFGVNQFGRPYNVGSNAFSGIIQSPADVAKAERQRLKKEAEKIASQLDPRILAAPAQIPAQPPICFVDFSNLVGWRNIPLRMYQFFRQRDKVLHGAELALTIVYGSKESAREFQAGRQGTLPEQVSDRPPQGGDLDWGIDVEQRYPPYFIKTEKNIANAREKYYAELPKHLKDARDLARGLREQTKIEKGSPSKTEAELREERLQKEKEWRNNDMGYQIVRPEAGVAWHEKFRGSLRVFELSPELRQRIDDEQRQRAQAHGQSQEQQAQQHKMDSEQHIN